MRGRTTENGAHRVFYPLFPERGGGKLFTAAALAALLLSAAARASAPPPHPNNDPIETGLKYEDRECLMCHSAEARSEKKGGYIKAVSLEGLHESVHKDIHCVQCHRGARLDPRREHMTSITLVECGDCHYEGNRVGAPQKDIAADYYAGVHGQSLLADSKSLAPHCWDCHTGHSVKKPNVKESSVDRERVVEICTGCHYDERKMRKYNLRASLIVQFDKTPHAVARTERGNMESAICTDCHGNHNIKHRDEPSNPLSHDNLPRTCGRCHEKVFETYKTSVHGADWLNGNRDVPVCSTCHGEHEIRHIKRKDATVYASNIVSLCSDCHADENLRWRYGIEEDPVRTYRETYHGIEGRFGDVRVANCASCHGFHDILHPEDPRSSVNPANLPRTCGACHKPAELNLNLGKIHDETEPAGSNLLSYIRLAYVILIAGSLGGMLFFISTDLLGGALRRRRKAPRRHTATYPAPPSPAPGSGLPPDDLEILRWPRVYRIQHFILIASFTVLAVTGIPLVLPDLFSSLLRNRWLYESRGIVHRAAGGVMIAMCLYHVLFVALNRFARKDILAMIPRPKDALDAAQTVLYNLTLRKEHPKLPRYNFIEKFEYLAMVWGSFVMVVTGLVLTFGTPLLQYFPKWVFDAATLIHKFEAILATLSILVWHMYTVHLCPDFFPMNRVFLTGMIKMRNLRKHHGAEYDEIVKASEGREGAEKSKGREGALWGGGRRRNG
ncbi:MAG: cytochrome b/b6 domain-containing protein [bacterium]